MPTFRELFSKATGRSPFPYQERLAASESSRTLVNVPTGSGKTAAAFFSWLWRRRFAGAEIGNQTPRRLVYCLPMRVLVEQTRDSVTAWLETLNLKSEIGLVVLMGGEDENDWDLCPERDAVVVGTQDMLLSRALNRGYAASRSRWPIQFALLNNDCRWVLDEVQLMGPGLVTTAQLDAFRASFGGVGAISSLWMSATLRREWLDTADFDSSSAEFIKLKDGDKSGVLKDVIDAAKPLARAKNTFDDTTALAGEILNTHRPGSRTLVVLNSVRKAVELYEQLEKAKKKADPNVPVALLHSRFRPPERKEKIGTLLSVPDESGTIIISTQVVEAGVDVSARTLFTELAPWSSLVQRFGRCNRRGEYKQADAHVFWIDSPKGDEGGAAPYEASDLDVARQVLNACRDVGISHLPQEVEMRFPRTETLRQRDLVDLFDTTPDLAGNDIDIDRYVRGIDDSDVRVFWREYQNTPNRADGQKPESAPSRRELCPAPIGGKNNPGFREFVGTHSGQVWRWNFLGKGWEQARPNQIVPGQTFLIDARAGGYSTEYGWDPDSGHRVESIHPNGDPPDATDDDRLSRIGVWQTIGEHVEEVCTELEEIATALPISDCEVQAMRHAARWHDRGKAHDVFQAALPAGVPDSAKVWAKAKGAWKPYSRPHFRHELASALAVLDPRNDRIPDAIRDLVAYLVASHHGKVRLSIRSLPNERHPPPRSSGSGSERRFARGVWDDDELPATDLGGGNAPAVTLSLEPMELGLCMEQPFADQPSWAERMIGLRDTLGPFRLAYLEAIVRAADMRASREAERREAARENGQADAARKETAGA